MAYKKIKREDQPTEVYVANSYEFTACCGSRLQKDRVSCDKCNRKVSRVYSKGEEIHFLDVIWWHDLRERFGEGKKDFFRDAVKELLKDHPTKWKQWKKNQEK